MAEMNRDRAEKLQLPVRPALLSSEKVFGCVDGIGIGDALGLPLETLTADQIATEFGRVTSLLPVSRNKYFPLSGAGTTSDDLQLSLAVMRALVIAGGFDVAAQVTTHIEAMGESDAGWGGTTRRAVLKLSQGMHWSESGKPGGPQEGTGNGVSMKIAPLAAYYVACGVSIGDRLAEIATFTGMTHRTNLALSAALGSAAAVAYCLRSSSKTFSRSEFAASVIDTAELGRNYFPESEPADEMIRNLQKLSDWSAFDTPKTVTEFGGGTCYVSSSVPFSLMFFMRNPYSIESLYDVINGGGDTDSNGAMLAGLLGAMHGPDIFPQELRSGILRGAQAREIAEEFCRRFHLVSE